MESNVKDYAMEIFFDECTMMKNVVWRIVQQYTLLIIVH